MHKIWISAALAPALALQAGPLWAQQRAPTTVVACSGAFAKDSSHLLIQKTLLSPMSSTVTVAKSPLQYCSLMTRSVDSKCGGPIQPPVRIFI